LLQASWAGMPSPLCSYPANGYGLADMIGNGREWTDTLYGPTNRPLWAALLCLEHRRQLPAW